MNGHYRMKAYDEQRRALAHFATHLQQARDHLRCARATAQAHGIPVDVPPDTALDTAIDACIAEYRRLNAPGPYG